MNQAKERPILFSGPMVRAILEGRKTQTRRVVKLKKYFKDDIEPLKLTHDVMAEMIELDGCPYGKPGDRLWVREKHKVRGLCSGCYEYACDCGHFEVTYAADNKINVLGEWDCESDFPKNEYWRPSLFMPRFLSRLTLGITNVRVERLQDISEADSRAEGITEALNYSGSAGWGDLNSIPFQQHNGDLYSCKNSFMHLWNGINGDGSWNQNPWVWVIEFNQIKELTKE
jgi:hypothetical protein